MKLYYIIFLSLLISFSCTNVKRDISKKEEIKFKEEKIKISSIEKELSDSVTDSLPLGLFKLTNDDFQLNLNSEVGYTEYKEIFDYYDSLHKKESIRIVEELSNLSYIPNNTYTLDKDRHPLLGDEENETKLKTNFFKIIKKLPKISDLHILILSGSTPYNEYNTIDRLELIILNSKLKIINEFNIYYEYASEISTKQKFFHIDQNYNISIRYYFEKEGKSPYFSVIEKFKITKQGEILFIN